MLRKGSKAPDFRLKGSDGRMHRLAEFKGKRIVLYFYPRDNTPGCTIEAKGFNKSLPRFRKSGVEVIGVSNDGISSHRSFRSKCSLKFLLLSDPKSSIIKKYGAYGSRGIFGIGTLRKTFVIDKNLKIAKIYEKVRPLGHDREVLSFLAQR